MRYLRYNTSAQLPIGPFLSTTDGVTLKTALTVANSKLSLIMQTSNNSAPSIIIDNTTCSTTGDNAMNYVSGADDSTMQLALTAANTAYLGHGRITVVDAANHCPVWEDVTILPAQVYDSMILGSDLLDTNVSQISGTNVSTGEAQLGVNVIQAAGTAWASGAITANVLAGDCITSAKIADDAIASEHLATGALTADAFAADALVAATFATDSITADAIAADAVTEIQSGLATAAALGAIGSGVGAALNFEVTDDNTDSPLNSVTFIGTQVGDYQRTLADDNSDHEITSASDAGTEKIRLVYKFSCGGGRNATKLVIRAHMAAVGDTVSVKVWDFSGTPAWDTMATISGTTETLYDIPLYSGHTGTGADAGIVYVYFDYDENDAGTLHIDQCYVTAQNLGQTIGYANGSIWIEADAGGNTGTTPYVDGTGDNPCTYAAAKTLSTTLGIKRFTVEPGTTITLDAALSGAVMTGRGYALALGGQNIAASYFEGIESLSGIGVTSPNAEAIFVDCHVNAVTLGEFDFVRCHLHNTITLGTASKYYRIHNCTGIENATIEFGAATQTLALSEMSGAITITGMTTGDMLYVDGNGVLTLGATCDGGTVHISGNIELTNSGSGQTITYGATKLGAMAHGGAAASLTLKNVVIDTGEEASLDAVSITGDGTSSDGVAIVGKVYGLHVDGNTAGLAATGQTSGKGGYFSAGSSRGIGMQIAGKSDGGLTVTETSGSAVVFSAGGTGHGLELSGGTAGSGLKAIGYGGDPGALFTVGSTGDGVQMLGGSVSGHGLYVEAADDEGILVAAGQDHSGIKIAGGALGGTGLEIAGGSGTGDGISITTTDGDGLVIAAAGVGKVDINADLPAVTLADGSHGGGTATLELKAITVSNADGDAVTIAATGSNGNALALTGNGTGSGLSAIGGDTGNGIIAIGGATSGDGIAALAANDGDGISAAAAGGGNYDLNAPNSDLSGVDLSSATLPAVTLADSVTHGGLAATLTLKSILVSNADGDAVSITASGSNGAALALVGNGSGAALSAIGGATGAGAYISGGATSGTGVQIEATSGNALAIASQDGNAVSAYSAAGGDAINLIGVNGIDISSTGAGITIVSSASEGIHVEGGAGAAVNLASTGSNGDGVVITGHGTGDGVAITGGSTSGDGISATGAGTGHGIRAVNGASGVGLYATSNNLLDSMTADLTEAVVEGLEEYDRSHGSSVGAGTSLTVGDVIGVASVVGSRTPTLIEDLFSDVRTTLRDANGNMYTTATMTSYYNRAIQECWSLLTQIGAEIVMNTGTIITDGTGQDYQLPADFRAFVPGHFLPRSPVTGTSDYSWGPAFEQVPLFDRKYMTGAATTNQTPTHFTVFWSGNNQYVRFNTLPASGEIYDFRYYPEPQKIAATDISTTFTPWLGLLDQLIARILEEFCREGLEFITQKRDLWRAKTESDIVQLLGLRLLVDNTPDPSMWKGFPS